MTACKHVYNNSNEKPAFQYLARQSFGPTRSILVDYKWLNCHVKSCLLKRTFAPGIQMSCYYHKYHKCVHSNVFTEVTHCKTQ